MELETFPNPAPHRDFIIRHVADEFTSVCPKTGHPDYATIVLTYVADEVCLELKAYKLYLQSYRNEGIFYEAVTNKLLDDLVAAATPRWMRLETRWTGRGGIRSVLRADFAREGTTIPADLPAL
jgi:7-cyano-7-deazaguanine reductase